MAELLTAARARELADAWDESGDDTSGVRALDMCEALRSHADALDSGATTTPPSAVAWLAARVGEVVEVFSRYTIPVEGRVVLVAPDGVVTTIVVAGREVGHMVSLTGHPVVYRVRVVESAK